MLSSFWVHREDVENNTSFTIKPVHSEVYPEIKSLLASSCVPPSSPRIRLPVNMTLREPLYPPEDVQRLPPMRNDMRA